MCIRDRAETVPVRAAGKARHVLAADLDALRTAVCDTGVWRMLGPHDPYLDLRDRTVLLDDVQKQRIVWQTVSNPGALLCGGRIAGVWRQKQQKAALSVEMVLFEPADAAARQSLEQEAAQYAAFRGAALREVVFQRAG